MALQGTLGDFGLPDIFQLVGHQQKTGVLLLKDLDVEVKIYFVDGNVVKAEQGDRHRADLLGNIMVRGGAITQAQLDAALATQHRTLRRLGDILIEMGATDRQTLKDFARLQTTETIYRLFMWRKGTYEFTASQVDYDEQSYEPIRAENVLMEGFRMVDEWPAVRKVIPSARCTFVVLKGLPQAQAPVDDDDDILAGMADAFGGSDSGEHAKNDGPAKLKVGSTERHVFTLVTPPRTVQDIVDLSRLGEFETSKALAALVQNGHLRVVLPSAAELEDAEPLTMTRAFAAAMPVATRLALYAVVAAAVGGLVHIGTHHGTGMLAKDTVVLHGASLPDQVGDVSLLRLAQALEVYRLLEGRYPDQLHDLVAPGPTGTGVPLAGLITDRELRFPFDTLYAYRRIPAENGRPESYSLALPLR